MIRKKFTSSILKNEDLLTIGFLIIFLSYRLYQFRSIPFGSPDDTFMAAKAMSSNGNLDSALNQASSQGRFYQFFFMFSTLLVHEVVPHQFLWMTVSLQIVFFVIALKFCIDQISNDSRIGTLVALLFVTFYDFRGGYNNLTSFPLWFCFSFSLFLIAIGMQKYIYTSGRLTNGKFRHIPLVLCLVASLAYESYLLFPLVFILIDLYFSLEVDKSNITLKGKLLKYLGSAKSRIITVLFFFSIYFILYFWFQKINPSNYPGTQVSFNSISLFTSTIARMSLAGFSSFYLSIEDFNYLDLKSHIISAWPITPFLLGALLVIIYLIFRVRRSSNHLSLLPILTLLSLIPNFLYAITSRYQLSAVSAPLYLGALLSSVPLLFGLVICLQLIRFLAFNLQFIVAVVLSIYLFNAAIINNQNIDFYTDERRSQNVAWQFANDFILDQKNLGSDTSEVVSPDLINIIQSHVTYRYWSEYFTRQLHSEYEILDSDSSIKGDRYISIEILSLSKNKCFIVTEKDRRRDLSRIQSIYIYEQSSTSNLRNLIQNGFNLTQLKSRSVYKLNDESFLSNFENSEEVRDYLRSLIH